MEETFPQSPSHDTSLVSVDHAERTDFDDDNLGLRAVDCTVHSGLDQMIPLPTVLSNHTAVATLHDPSPKRRRMYRFGDNHKHYRLALEIAWAVAVGFVGRYAADCAVETGWVAADLEGTGQEADFGAEVDGVAERVAVVVDYRTPSSLSPMV